MYNMRVSLLLTRNQSFGLNEIKKNEAVGLLSAQSLQMLRPWSLQDTLHHRSNHITLQSGKERHVTDWPLR